MNKDIATKLWELGVIDSCTLAKEKFKMIGIKNPSHKQKMKYAKFIGVPKFRKNKQ